MVRCEGIRLSWHSSISGARQPKAATAEADYAGCVQHQWGNDGLASGLQICPSAMLKANSEPEVGQVASPSVAFVLSQAVSSEPRLPWGKVPVDQDSTSLDKVGRDSETQPSENTARLKVFSQRVWTWDVSWSDSIA